MTRTLSGAVLAVVIVGSLLWSPWSFGAVLALLVAALLFGPSGCWALPLHWRFSGSTPW